MTQIAHKAAQQECAKRLHVLCPGALPSTGASHLTGFLSPNGSVDAVAALGGTQRPKPSIAP